MKLNFRIQGLPVWVGQQPQALWLQDKPCTLSVESNMLIRMIYFSRFRLQRSSPAVSHNRRPPSQKTLRAFTRLLYKLFVCLQFTGNKPCSSTADGGSRWKEWTKTHKIQVLQLRTQLRLISKIPTISSATSSASEN